MQDVDHTEEVISVSFVILLYAEWIGCVIPNVLLVYELVIRAIHGTMNGNGEPGKNMDVLFSIIAIESEPCFNGFVVVVVVIVVFVFFKNISGEHISTMV